PSQASPAGVALPAKIHTLTKVVTGPEEGRNGSNPVAEEAPGALPRLRGGGALPPPDQTGPARSDLHPPRGAQGWRGTRGQRRPRAAATGVRRRRSIYGKRRDCGRRDRRPERRAHPRGCRDVTRADNPIRGVEPSRRPDALRLA